MGRGPRPAEMRVPSSLARASACERAGAMPGSHLSRKPQCSRMTRAKGLQRSRDAPCLAGAPLSIRMTPRNPSTTSLPTASPLWSTHCGLCEGAWACLRLSHLDLTGARCACGRALERHIAGARHAVLSWGCWSGCAELSTPLLLQAARRTAELRRRQLPRRSTCACTDVWSTTAGTCSSRASRSWRGGGGWVGGVGGGRGGVPASSCACPGEGGGPSGGAQPTARSGPVASSPEWSRATCWQPACAHCPSDAGCAAGSVEHGPTPCPLPHPASPRSLQGGRAVAVWGGAARPGRHLPVAGRRRRVGRRGLDCGLRELG